MAFDMKPLGCRMVQGTPEVRTADSDAIQMATMNAVGQGLGQAGVLQPAAIHPDEAEVLGQAPDVGLGRGVVGADEDGDPVRRRAGPRRVSR